MSATPQITRDLAHLAQDRCSDSALSVLQLCEGREQTIAVMMAAVVGVLSIAAGAYGALNEVDKSNLDPIELGISFLKVIRETRNAEGGEA